MTEEEGEKEGTGSALNDLLSFTEHDSTYLTFLKHHTYKSSNYGGQRLKSEVHRRETGVSIEKQCAYALC